MLWYETLELLYELVAKQVGGYCALHYSEACGYYIVVEVLGEPDKTLVTRDSSSKADALEVALEFVQAFKD